MNDDQGKDFKSYLTLRNSGLFILFLLPIILGLTLFFSQDKGEYTRLGNATYAFTKTQARCPDGSRPGSAGLTHGESSREGIKYNVRTPLNYDPTLAHPLLMVYAPAGQNRSRSEKSTGLTYPATEAGFIVAYADHPELSSTSTIELGTIPGLIAKKWCIDEQRIFLTGHSDGGTAAMALAFMAGTRHIPSAIAPSAAGVNHLGLQGHSCPEPIPVMIMHSAKDRHFPGYGIESSGWWASCNDCDPIPEQLDNGCIAYTGCAEGVSTWYCEGNQSHSKWPGIDETIIQFFTSVRGGKVKAKPE